MAVRRAHAIDDRNLTSARLPVLLGLSNLTLDFAQGVARPHLCNLVDASISPRRWDRCCNMCPLSHICGEQRHLQPRPFDITNVSAAAKGGVRFTT